MATYAKILKDNSGNSILPYTRSKFVYMDDNTTVEDSISNLKKSNSYELPVASYNTLGGVRQGHDIDISSDGTIDAIRVKASTGAIGIVSVTNTYTSIISSDQFETTVSSRGIYNMYQELLGKISPDLKSITRL